MAKESCSLENNPIDNTHKMLVINMITPMKIVDNLPVDFPVLEEGFLSIKNGDFFSEFFKNLKLNKKQILN